MNKLAYKEEKIEQQHKVLHELGSSDGKCSSQCPVELLHSQWGYISPFK